MNNEPSPVAGLPEDVLLVIFEQLAAPEPGHMLPKRIQTSSLAAICLSNGSFRLLALPQLYRALEFPFWDTEDKPRVRSLLRTLLHSPAYVRFVRHLDLDLWPYDLSHCEFENIFDAGGLDKLVAITNRLLVSTTLRQSIIKLLRATGWQDYKDAPGAILLAWFPSLESVDIICLWSPNPPRLVERLISEAGGYPQGVCGNNATDVPLKKLRSATRGIDDPDSAMTHASLITVYSLPSLRSFEVVHFMCDGKEHEGRMASDLMVPSSIRDLKLHTVALHSEGLEAILKACVQLQEISIDHHSALDGADEEFWNARSADVQLGKLGEVIRQHGKGLQRLELILRDRTYDAIDELGSLKSIQSLRDLAISVGPLLGIGWLRMVARHRLVAADELICSLPASLRTLELYDEDNLQRTDAAVAMLIAARDDFPYLRHVKVYDVAFDRASNRFEWRDSDHMNNER